MKYDAEENAFRSDGSDITPHLPQVVWHVTDICPLDCAFCFAPKTMTSTDHDRVRPTADRLRDLGVLKVDVSGGEPLFYEALPSVIDHLQRVGIPRTLSTSGMALEPNRQFLRKNYNLFSRIIVSIDAPSEEEHNHLRGHADAWSSVHATVEEMPDGLRRRICRVNTVVTRRFVEGEWLVPMGMHVARLAPREWCLIEPHPANQKAAFADHWISGDAFRDTLAKASALVNIPRLISRNREMYAGYWVLHPSGRLRQHSSGSADGTDVDLLNEPIERVRQVIASSSMRVPLVENN